MESADFRSPAGADKVSRVGTRNDIRRGVACDRVPKLCDRILASDQVTGIMVKILIIDDEPGVRSALRRILTADGHEVLEAANGAEATRIVEGENIDLVFTDIFMPEMDGIEFVLWVVDHFPDCPVVAMSGGGATPMGSVLDDARALGAVDVVEKPLDPERIRRIVSEHRS